MGKASELFEKKGNSNGLIIDMLYLIMSIILIVFMCGIFEDYAHAQTGVLNDQLTVSIKDGDEWHYFKGVEKPPRDWKSSGFDHSNWQKGPSGLGYGIGSNRTYLSDMRGNYSTVYAWREFTIGNPGAVTGMKLSVICDGPFIAYLNGIEVIRTNTVQINQSLSMPQVEQFDISGLSHELFPQGNSLSLECNNDDINSAEFSFIPFFEVTENKEVQQ